MAGTEDQHRPKALLRRIGFCWRVVCVALDDFGFFGLVVGQMVASRILHSTDLVEHTRICCLAR